MLIAVIGLGSTASLFVKILDTRVVPQSLPPLLHRVVAPAHSDVIVATPAMLPHLARPVGLLPAQKRLDLLFALLPRNAAALERAAHAISTPGSPSYHRYLSPGTIATRFGPTPATIQAVVGEARLLGLRVGALSANHLMLHISGSVGALSGALRTHLESVQLPDGHLGWRLVSAAILPSAISHEVTAVVGLNNVAVAHAMVALSHDASGNTLPGVQVTPSPCVAASAAVRLNAGWTESQIASAYGLSSLYGAGDFGAGQTIAVVELEPFVKSDIATFDRCYFGASRVALVHRVPIDGFNFSGPGSGESALDIESLSALAPDARIDVYEAPNTTIGTLDTYDQIVSADSANVITTSWGECEQLLDASSPGARQLENFLFEEAAAQGQTVIAATGDSGSDDCATTPFGSDRPVAPYLSVDDPASQPYVLGVGGTTLRSNLQPLTALSEIAWNDGSQGGASGGGVSSNWASPSWQSGSGVPGVSALLGRQVPDVSASADSELGMTVYSSSFGKGGWATIGGTSAAAPIWAAVLAEIAASGSTGTACSALPAGQSGPDLGFVPPLLYEAAATSYSTNFHAIALGTNDVFLLGLGYRATFGYNMVGGLGSPIVTNPNGQPGLASSLCAEAAQSSTLVPARPVPTAISPSYGVVSGGTNVTITLSQPLVEGAKVSVSFAGQAGVVSNASGTSITVITPPAVITAGASPVSSAGPAAVSVTELVGSGSSTSAPSSGLVFEYVNVSVNGVVPSVSGVNPSAGNLAGGTIISVYGSGFLAGPVTVSIGGVAATGVEVISDHLLRAIVPAKSATTTCATGSGFDLVSLCQSTVTVSDANGSSATAPILPVLTGPLVYNSLGDIASNGATEIAPGATEYDYAPIPTIVSIRPNPASPRGRTIVRIIGRGFSLNTLDWVNFGPPNDVNSQQIKLGAITNREIDLEAPPALHLVGRALEGGVTVQSAAGLSKPKGFSYLGVPVVSSVATLSGGTGGAKVVIGGSGLLGVTHLQLINEMSGAVAAQVSGRSLILIQRNALVVRLPRERPGPYLVRPCNDLWCAVVSAPSATFVYKSVVVPSITHVIAETGPDSGTSIVTIFGANLAGVISVEIGSERDTRLVAGGAAPIGDPRVCTVLVARAGAVPGARVRVTTDAGISGAVAISR